MANRSSFKGEPTTDSSGDRAHSEAVFAGAGEMAERLCTFDWSKTPLGPVTSWPPSLRMMVKFLLANRFPLLLWWGPQYISIYNDSYRPVLGTKHPWALGQPVKECWSEIWHILQPLIDTPFNGGPATWNEDILLEINRYGFVEETHFTIAYSPVPDESVTPPLGRPGEPHLAGIRDAADERGPPRTLCPVMQQRRARRPPSVG